MPDQIFLKERAKNKTRLNGKHEPVRVENNHPAIIDKETFSQVQALMAARCPKVTHPRTNISDYLLRGLIECGKCHGKMIGSSAKSGKHSYYACHNYLKRGKSVCDAKLINRNNIERLLVERLKTHVLTEENLIELFAMVHDEIKQNQRDSESQLATIDKHLEAAIGKRSNLYNALETGKLDIDDLAPRLKEIKAEINKLEASRNEILEEAKNPKGLPFDLKTVKNYTRNLTLLLSKGSIFEQKSFLRSFIKKIVVNHPEAQVEYNFPIIKKKVGKTSDTEVLPTVQFGSPRKTRMGTGKKIYFCRPRENIRHRKKPIHFTIRFVQSVF